MTIKIFTVLTVTLCGLIACAQTGTNVLRPETSSPQSTTNSTGVITGRTLFLKNCVHCHGADATGDEGSDLHKLDWTGEQIAARIRNGKKGQMTSFAGKLKPSEIAALTAYVQTLK